MYHEMSYTTQNDECFEENLEDLVNSYLDQRHIYSASLPLPVTTDIIIDQIRAENHQRRLLRDSVNYELRQQLLQTMAPPRAKANSLPRLIIEVDEESSVNMREIVEVTSSAEQSPTDLKSMPSDAENFWMDNLDTDEISDISAEVSQEIR